MTVTMGKNKAKDLKKSSTVSDHHSPVTPTGAVQGGLPPLVTVGVLVSLVAILFKILTRDDFCTIDSTKNIIQDGHKLLQDIVEKNSYYHAKFLVPNTIVQFDGILNDEEITYMKDYLERRHFGASKTMDKQAHTINAMRTSQTAWCVNECMTNPAVVALEEKIAAITSIPAANYEHLQFLKYEGNGKEYYKEHTDHIIAQTETGPGPRILTFFFYLSEVDAGETLFPTYNLKVSPKAGRAILWLNTLSENILERHPGTRHEALPVEGGTKYAGNVWIHLRNYRGAFQSGCHK